jgi:hypothetical protein
MEVRQSFQTIALPFPGERMGLYGLEFMHETPSGFAAGLGGYGAITGQRGGFITVGLAGGWRPRLTERLALDLGLFSGGGGAGRAAVGGGWMLEGHAGFEWRLDAAHLGLAYQRIRFPNGEIDSRQWRFSFALPFALPTLAPGPSLPAVPWREVEVESTVLHYAPSRGVRLLDGQPGEASLSLVGFAAKGALGGPFFLSLELAAAHTGGADGYMEGLLGLGARARLDGWRLSARIAGGPAGGGHLDVGGGMAWKAAAGLERDLGAGLFLGAEAGWMTTPGASFRAMTTQVSLGRRFRLAEGAGEAPEPGWTLQFLPLRIRAGVSELTHPRRGAADGGTPVRSQTLALDLPFSNHLYLTGQAGFGTSGRAGGWATGLLGLGAEASPLGAGPRALAELLIGAGGGGGLDSRGGAIVQPMVGLAQRLGGAWELQLRGGRLKSLRGGIDSTILEVGVAWRTGLAAVGP